MVPTNEDDSCVNNPNFAVICSFLQKYAGLLGILNPNFKDLRAMIESNDEGEF